MVPISRLVLEADTRGLVPYQSLRLHCVLDMVSFAVEACNIGLLRLVSLTACAVFIRSFGGPHKWANGPKTKNADLWK